jgi:hypothetical protein
MRIHADSCGCGCGSATLWKTKLMENSNFCLFAAKGKWKRQTFVYFLQMENVSLFFLDGKQKMVNEFAVSANVPFYA